MVCALCSRWRTLTFFLWKTLPCSINRADGAFFRVLFAEAVLLKSGVRKPPFERQKNRDKCSRVSVLCTFPFIERNGEISWMTQTRVTVTSKNIPKVIRLLQWVHSSLLDEVGCNGGLKELLSERYSLLLWEEVARNPTHCNYWTHNGSNNRQTKHQIAKKVAKNLSVSNKKLKCDTKQHLIVAQNEFHFCLM